MADMATFIRAIFSVLVALAAFVVSFLVIFVPMLFLDMHYAPHDGQGGMSGFFIGIPVATIASLLAGPLCYVHAKRKKWFA
ncbi:hypothetical protein Terro_3194 [Terriglobus roseus DSM 18391]|uniref:Uncharacterized protein n=2 Tax=Terriglobus roseus TaxID=392734 RepID=I3ZJ02_TERRK|nr:hypothetical protein Terro_2988 [Terriglobus roseus DSM 18391]AFL89416.1 hypothetical protein Terro_3194 [Terriglobus roseus DSM 18391]